MASATYENILREVEQLTPVERIRLSVELNRSIDLPTGADFIAAMRMGEQLDPDIADEMKRIIEEGCESINPHDE